MRFNDVRIGDSFKVYNDTLTGFSIGVVLKITKKNHVIMIQLDDENETFTWGSINEPLPDFLELIRG